MGSELVRPTAIMQYVKQGEIESDLAVEDFEAEKARWAAGGTAGDLRVVTALTAIEEGRALIDLSVVLDRAGGSQNTGMNSRLPRLTVAPAFSREVSIRVWHDGEMRIRAKQKGIIGRRGWEKTHHSNNIRFDRSTAISYSAVATVPMLPPEVRAVARKDHLILWEAGWRKVGTEVQRPPMDPALLEHISGDLYVVLAAWDLSPLEAAALS